MVMSISEATPQKKIGVMDKVTQEQLYSPGKYSSPVVIYDGPPPSSNYSRPDSFVRFLGKLVLTATAVCGAAVAMRKWVPAMKKDILNVSEKVDPKSTIIYKAKYYIAKFADSIENQLKELFAKAPKNSASAAPQK